MNPYWHITSPVYVFNKLGEALARCKDPRIRRKIIFHMEEMLDVIEDQDLRLERVKVIHTSPLSQSFDRVAPNGGESGHLKKKGE